jgi:hypothetical protein
MHLLQSFSVPRPPYFTIDEFVAAMTQRNRPGMQELLDEHRDLFQTAAGSKTNHQAWPGGYWDHITECLNLALTQFTLWDAMGREPPYVPQMAFEVLFVHDLEKPWKYIPDALCPIPVPELNTKPQRAAFRLELLAWYDIRFTRDQQNALRYAEGELDDYNANARVMGPLAHLCHTCDETSARQFPEHPQAQNDGWAGAQRIATIE